MNLTLQLPALSANWLEIVISGKSGGVFLGQFLLRSTEFSSGSRFFSEILCNSLEFLRCFGVLWSARVLPLMDTRSSWMTRQWNAGRGSLSLKNRLFSWPRTLALASSYSLGCWFSCYTARGEIYYVMNGSRRVLLVFECFASLWLCFGSALAQMSK